MPVMSARTQYQVVICGGGVAALEAAAALREHAGDRVALTLIAPEVEFVYRPLAPASAFGYPDPPRVALDQIAAGMDATLIGDRVSWIDRAAGVVHTDAGAGVAYDALIVCVGATARVVYEHALTIDGRATGELDALIASVQTGEVERVAFVAHDRLSWPLPLYEAALMSATLAAEAGRTPQLTIVTPESRPLEVFGEHAGRQMEELLAELGFDLFTRARAEVPDPHEVIIGQTDRGTEQQPSRRRVDRVVALPELVGPHLRGLPSVDQGFIPTDHSRSGLRCSPTGRARLSRRSSPRTSTICWTRGALHRAEPLTARSQGSANVVPSLDPVDGWRCTVMQAIAAAAATSASAM